MRRIGGGGASVRALVRLRRHFVGGVSPTARRAAAMLVDALIVVEAFLLALLFRFDGAVPDRY